MAGTTYSTPFQTASGAGHAKTGVADPRGNVGSGRPAGIGIVEMGLDLGDRSRLATEVEQVLIELSQIDPGSSGGGGPRTQRTVGARHIQRGEIAGSDEMESGPHQRCLHHGAVGERSLEVMYLLVVTARPESDIGPVGMLGLESGETADNLRHAPRPTFDQTLPIERRPVETLQGEPWTHRRTVVMDLSGKVA